MSTQVLVVTADEGTADIVGHCIEEIGGAMKLELLVDRAKHRREAEVRLDRGPYGLVVTDAELPDDAHAAVNEGAHGGLSVMGRAKQVDAATPVIVLGLTFEKVIAEETGASDADYVLRDGGEWDSWLAKVVRKCLQAQPARHKDLRLEVDIYLQPAGKYHSHLNIVGLPGSDWEEPLELNPDELTRLSLECEDLEGAKHWQRHLGYIGETLFRQIFEANPRFFKRYYRYLAKIDDEKNVSIRFVVDRNVHPIVLEALKETGDAHWMLKGPIYRRVNLPSDRYALFQDQDTRERPVNCLLIEANLETQALIPKLGIALDRLENVKSEIAWLKRRLEELRKANPRLIGEVAVVDGPGRHARFGDAVHEAVSSGSWHLIHFAGHSHFGGNIGRVFFPSARGQPIEERTIEELSDWLRRCDARFVFLSSCHSSEEDFVFELASAHVPAVLGFRWNIEDELAEEYTKSFYTHLFRELSLESAFFEARKQMHATNRDKRIWASPILVMQTKKGE